MLNQCTFIGRLGADPEVKALNSGDKVANIRIAATESWKDKNGERKEKTEWVQIVVFGNLVNVVETYLKKGSLVFVSGKLQTRKWQDQSGADRYSTEIVLQGFNGVLKMLDSRQSGEQGMYDDKPQQGQGGGFSSDLDSEIPF